MKQVLSLALVFCGAVFGSPPAETTGVEPRVCVLVFDAADLSPLPDSTVVFRPVRADDAAGRAGVLVPSGEPSVQLATGNDGVACAERLPPGNYLPEASRPGFWSTRSQPFRFPPEACEIPAETPDRLDLRIGLAARWAADAERSREGGEPVSDTSALRAPLRRLRVTAVDWENVALPGVTVWLTPMSDLGSDPEEAWLSGRAPTAGGGPLLGVTRNRGGFCFDDLPAGRYRVRAQLEGFGETEVGPIEVPPSAFGQVKLPIALELTWAEREALKTIVSLCEGWPDMLVERPGPPPDDCP